MLRREIAKLALLCYDRDISNYLKEARDLFSSSLEVKKNLQKDKLSKLLIHAYKNTVYYKNVFDDIGLIKGHAVDWERYHKIPLLTKEIIRARKKDLLSNDAGSRESYNNTSGGSTGVPVEFVQDKEYYRKMVADTILSSEVNGKMLGDRAIKLWGDEREILKIKSSFKEKLINIFYNRMILNSFLMTPEKMGQYIKIINSKKPREILAYVDSIYELARFILDKNIKVFNPQNIICTAGTLYPDIKERIKRAFPGSKVLNQYGSREVGIISIDMPIDSMQVFTHSIALELCNLSTGNYIKGGPGNIIVTCLNNYSMPLIRFDIGDIGEGDMESYNDIPDSYTFSTLKNVKGRINSHFKKRDGMIIHGEYFTHLFYHLSWVESFRVVQHDYLDIEVFLKICGEKDQAALDTVEKNIKKVMGEDCKVNFRVVEKIDKLSSGKYQFVFSEVR
ncbi:MAG: hypothetical protein ABIG92_02025 [Candidatus Omnitrophota bacterium]